MRAYYIAETQLNNKSAYSHHVIKMCDAFGQNMIDTTLVIPNEKVYVNSIRLRKKFLLNSSIPFKIVSILNSKINNFFDRLKFGFKTYKYLKNKKDSLIITRSLYTSIFLSCAKIKHFLEIHTEQRSLTKLFLINLNFINSKYIIKVILISKALKKLYKINNNKVIILHDGVDPKNFSKKGSLKKIKRFSYIGSFYKGRGIEIILKLANRFKKLDFNLYGKNNLKISKRKKNIKIFPHVDYSEVPNILQNSDVLLMPYLNEVSINANNVNTANYCSPLKMFDYLAAGKIIMSSKLDGICEVLKHNKNSIIVKSNNFKDWSYSLKKILTNYYNIDEIQKNALKTAKYYTWKKRASKIVENYVNQKE